MTTRRTNRLRNFIETFPEKKVKTQPPRDARSAAQENGPRREIRPRKTVQRLYRLVALKEFTWFQHSSVILHSLVNNSMAR
ncbi:hypothetical protein HMPREF0201_02553 [Cedecea davisae DSM 4568]|uniref:Uncharacterized protein n=1 Tax=Cedecea davisae DSM 4568 TaxID=566551 RepID=S3IR12_9ENTR|nr:hypothetical protein HMPREF0201_02553 [Cedecea davisae DSM 4568]